MNESSIARRTGIEGDTAITVAPLVLVFYWGALMGAANGSQVRTLGQLSFIAENFDNVVFYHYGNHPRDPWTAEDIAAFKARFPKVRLVVEQEKRALKYLNKLKKLLIMMSPGLAPRVLRWRIAALTPDYSALRAANPDIRYVVNYVDSLAQLNGIEGAKTVVETHDLRYFRRAKETKEKLISFKHLMGLRYEISALGAVKALVSITRNEAYFYRNMLPNSDIYYIPEYQPGGVEPPAAENLFEHDLLFAASGNGINVAGLLGLFDRHGPQLRSFRIALCGLICERPEIQDLAAAYPNITLLGFLSKEELTQTYARSRACLSPTDGTGLNIKLVEALRHRKPVFASRSSTEGLNAGFERCVFPLDPDAMTALLSDAERLARASDAAAAYYTLFSNTGDLEALGHALGGREEGALARQASTATPDTAEAERIS